MLRPALFLDRDGVINADTGYVHTREEFVFLPGIFSLVRAARAAGHLVVVVTNQAGIGRGYYSEAQFHELMDWVKARFREQGGDLDAVYFCPDHPAHGIGRYRRDSAWRKPGPGMLLQAAREHGIDLTRSVMVGDSPKDMEAGRAAGIGTLLYVGGEGSPEGARKVADLAGVEAALFPGPTEVEAGGVMRKSHIQKVVAGCPAAGSLADALAASVAMLAECVRSGGKILVCGNGGSAADAEHIVGELMKGFLLPRPLLDKEAAALEAAFPGEAEALRVNLQRAVPAVSLVASVSLATAFANDVAAEYIFAQQVFGLGKPGDVLWGISTSGNSRNILHAMRVARAYGVRTLGFTGRDGGAMAMLSDVEVRVPLWETPAIQELQLPLHHAVCAELEAELFGNAG